MAVVVVAAAVTLGTGDTGLVEYEYDAPVVWGIGLVLDGVDAPDAVVVIVVVRLDNAWFPTVVVVGVLVVGVAVRRTRTNV